MSSSSASDGLVGRDREQSVIDELLDAARSGRGGVLALVGEAGIGKSALLGYAASRALGMTVLSARGVQSEAHIPFAGLLELLRPALPSLDRLPAPQAEALQGALALRPSRGADRFAIGAATLSLLAAQADQAPLLVLLDDVHRFDGSSAAALSFAMRRLGADPVAVLLAVRQGEPSLLDGSDLPRHRLLGLDVRASAALVRRHEAVDKPALSEAEVEQLHRETGGNPLALLELSATAEVAARSPLGEPPAVVASVAGSFVRRFDVLPPASRQMLLLLAASDTDDLAQVARSAASLGVAAMDLEPAEAGGLVTVTGARAEWRHPLARSAVYASVSANERRQVHRALADGLPDADDVRRAWHLALATIGPDAGVSSALAQAAQRARDRSAYEESSSAFERAASFAESDAARCARLYAAADAAWLAGLGDRAEALLDDARQRAGTAVQIEIEHLRGHIACRRGRVHEGQIALRAASARAAKSDARAAVVMLAEAANACFHAGDPRTMRAVAADIARVRSRCDDARSEFFASMGEGMALVFSGDGERGPELLRRSVTILQGSDELRDDPRLLAWAAFGPLWLRDTEGSTLVDRAIESARERSLVGVLPNLLLHVAVYRASTDRWAEAEAAFFECVDLARQSGQEGELAAGLSRLAGLEARRGRAASCRAHAEEALALSARHGLALAEIWSFAALGDLELTRGRPKDAMEQYEQQVRSLAMRTIQDADLFPAPELVEVYLRLGREAEAERLSLDFWHRAARKQTPWVLARAGRTRGLVAAPDEFERFFDEALAHHALTVDVFEQARTRLAFGSRLRRSRHRARARDELRGALEAFDLLGADPWSERARAELAATGEVVGRRDGGHVRHLTPQELQIATLLAEQRTTREAAAALFLSPKTVEYHLRSIYRKLGVNSRGALAAAMKDW